jgi:hypothetical protein
LLSFAKYLGELSDLPGLLKQIFVGGGDKFGEPLDFGAGGLAGGQESLSA